MEMMTVQRSIEGAPKTPVAELTHIGWAFSGRVSKQAIRECTNLGVAKEVFINGETILFKAGEEEPISSLLEIDLLSGQEFLPEGMPELESIESPETSEIVGVTTIAGRWELPRRSGETNGRPHFWRYGEPSAFETRM